MKQYNIMMTRNGHTEKLTTARGTEARDHAIRQYTRAANDFYDFYDLICIYGEVAS